jgi:membrane protein YqaA with SNARE-associated domain
MSNTFNNSKQAEVKRRGGLRGKIIFLLMILLVIVITAGFFVLSRYYPEEIKRFENLGYIGVFLVSLITSSTVIVPVPPILVLFPIVVTYNPFLVGLVGATGGIIGEITGYMAGYGGQGMVNKKGKMYTRVEGWMKKWGSWVIFVFAAFFIFDIAGVVAGALRFPLWKFLLVGWAGKCIKYVGLMWLAVKGWEWALRFFG